PDEARRQRHRLHRGSERLQDRAHRAELAAPRGTTFRASERPRTMTFLRWVLAGIIATVVMDLGSTLIRKTGFTAGLEPRHIGRWFSSLVRSEPLEGTILQARPGPGEMPIALVGHYLIGITLS